MLISMAVRGITLDGDKLYRARLAARLSAARLGELTGVSGEHIRYVERGGRKVSLDLLAKLESVLGVTASELGADVPDARPPQIPSDG